MNSLLGRITGVITALAILAGSVALAMFLISLAPEPESRELPPQIPFVLTGTVTSSPGAIPVFGSGTVRPAREVNIAPQVGGRVESVNPAFRGGGRVEAGQTLFEIEEEDYRYRVEVAMADVAARRVALLEAEERADIAEAEYENFSRRQTGDAPAEPSPLTLRQPQLQAAEAALARDEARLAEARLALSRTAVTAPFDGYVRTESVDAGQIVAPGQSVGSLFAADAAEIPVALPDSDAALIPGLWELRAGDDSQQVAARVIAEYGEQDFAWSGYVDRAEASVDSQTRTVDVVIRVPDPFTAGAPVNGPAAGGNPPLLVGEYVDVEIEGVAMANIYRIPRAALQAGNEVWTVDGGGAVGIVPVRIFQRADDEAWVTGALRAGERVITGGVQFAIEGMRVLTGSEPL